MYLHQFGVFVETGLPVEYLPITGTQVSQHSVFRHHNRRQITERKPMDQKLYRATVEGNTGTLINLIRQDPLILDRSTVITTFLETPLHIAAMLGHEGFAIELLKQKPALAREIDHHRSSALHLASAKGHVKIVKHILLVDPDMCFVCDRDGKNPLHIAAMMGRTDALKEMLRVRPDAARAVVKRDGSGTILHLCVEYSQFEALKIIAENLKFDGDLINSKDRNGDTVLHLAVANKQVETTEFLLSVTATDRNAVNLSGMTAADILIQRRSDVRDLEIEESLKRAGASPPHKKRARLPPQPESIRSSRDMEMNAIWKKLLDNQGNWLEKKISGLMVVASLIATMAFQAGVSPPDNIWKETKTVDTRNRKDLRYYLTEAINHLKDSERFYMINTLSFIASLSIIMLLMSGLPLKRRLIVWLLMMITWIAITAIALSYTISVIISAPVAKEKKINEMVAISVFAWICLISLLLLGHTIRLFVKMIKLFVSMVKSLFRCCFVRKRVSGSARYGNNIRF